MAQPPPQRPQFSPALGNQSRDYAMPNGRSTSFGATSPQLPMTYSSPSPQPFSPQFAQAPPQKRAKLSPDAPSPFSNPQYPLIGTPQAVSPGPGLNMHAGSGQGPRPGSMAPPQRPAEKSEQDRSYNDILAGTGISEEEEQRNLNRLDYSGSGSFGSYQTPSFNQSNSAGAPSFSMPDGQATQITEEQRLQRENERLDWEAARHTQYALWDIFIYGGTINEKIKKFSASEHLLEAQAGVLVNTQRNAPPPTVRVNGLEGASRVIDRGQSILDTKDKADRLSDIMKLAALAAKTRLSGLITSCARLAIERREHSKGKIPEQWTEIAIGPKSAEETSDAVDAKEAKDASSLKRKRNDEPESGLPQHPAIGIFDKAATHSRTAEEARLAKRAKRKNKVSDDKDADGLDVSDAAFAAALDADKKTTKKERKATEAKYSEQIRHKEANEAARMATSSMFGRGFGKSGKKYSWLTGGSGGGTSSTASTPGRGIASSTSTPGTSTPVASRTSVAPRGRRLRQWDEDNDRGVTAKDVLLVLEHDPQAAKSFIKGCNMLDGKES